jgi:hypothetical protein
MINMDSSNVRGNISEQNCNSIPFYDLCVQLESVEQLKNVNEKFSAIFSKKLLAFLNAQSIFPLLRLLVPLIDSKRGNDLNLTLIQINIRIMTREVWFEAICCRKNLC